MCLLSARRILWAFGGVAIGAMGLGALAIRALAVKKGRIQRLDIEELAVGRRHVRELVVAQEQVRCNECLFNRLSRVDAFPEFRPWRRWWTFGVTIRHGQQVEWMSAPTFSVSRNSS
jgi:hypothetical protein